MKFDSYHVQDGTDAAIVHQKIQSLMSNFETVNAGNCGINTTVLRIVNQAVLLQINRISYYFFFIFFCAAIQVVNFISYLRKLFCQLIQYVVLKFSIKFHGWFLCLKCRGGSLHSSIETNRLFNLGGES